MLKTEILTILNTAESKENQASRIARLISADTKRIDWLADTNQNTGHVMLPTGIVERNIGSLRNAIDEAMELK